MKTRLYINNKPPQFTNFVKQDYSKGECLKCFVIQEFHLNITQKHLKKVFKLTRKHTTINKKDIEINKHTCTTTLWRTMNKERSNVYF